MELDKIRENIDKIDSEILTLFEQRMKLCEDVADYKAKNKSWTELPKSPPKT